MKLTALLMLLLVAVNGCGGVQPTGQNLQASIDGVWQGMFFMEAAGTIIEWEPLPGFESPPDTIRYDVTLTMRGCEFSVEIAPGKSDGDSWLFWPPQSNLEGHYRIKGDTVTFSTQENPTDADFAHGQSFVFTVSDTSLELTYVISSNAIDSTGHIVAVPIGCIPWGNAFGIRSGGFSRVQSQ